MTNFDNDVDNAFQSNMKTYPHVDMYAVGYQVGRIFLRSLKGEVLIHIEIINGRLTMGSTAAYPTLSRSFARLQVNPVMAWGNRPILAQTLKMGTDDEPMKEIMKMAREMENDKESKILAATFFGGFPMADFKFAGVSSICIADGDQHAAQAAVDRILDKVSPTTLTQKIEVLTTNRCTLHNRLGKRGKTLYTSTNLWSKQ